MRWGALALVVATVSLAVTALVLASKADGGLTTTSWLTLFTPLYVLEAAAGLAVFVFGCLVAIHPDNTAGERVGAVVWTVVCAGLVSCLAVFCTLLARRLDGVSKVSAISIATPLLVVETAVLVACFFATS